MIDLTRLEKVLYEYEIEPSLWGKGIDDFFLTGKAGAIREEYRCCNPVIARKMVDLANVQDSDKVLEPGAGKGMILKMLTGYERHYYCEINNYFVRTFLRTISANFIKSDFLTLTETFDKIIINPPFKDRLYAQHILHAYDLLHKGGTLVALYPANAHDLKITNANFLELISKGHRIDAGNVCGEDTNCIIFKITKHA